MKIERITRAELLARMQGQAVASHKHWAFRCIICGTIQSGASLMRSGAKSCTAERMIGFSCEGRLTDAGPWPAPKDHSSKAKKRRLVRGCDWTLGGLFKIQNMEVLIDDGELAEIGPTYWVQPCFDIATPEEAQGLEAWLRMTEQ